LRTEFEEIQLCLTANMETNLFIGNKYVSAVGGARFADIDPATERELGLQCFPYCEPPDSSTFSQPSADVAPSCRAASKPVVSSRLKAECTVVAAGLSRSVHPSARRTALGCSRPHWLIAFNLRAPANIAAVANVSRAGKR
jgi:hypothetical protein